MEKDRTLTIPVDWIRVFLVKKKARYQNKQYINV